MPPKGRGRGRGSQDGSGYQQDRQGGGGGGHRGRGHQEASGSGGGGGGNRGRGFGRQERGSYSRQESGRRGGHGHFRGDRGGYRGRGREAPARSFEGISFPDAPAEDSDDDVRFNPEDFGMKYKMAISPPILPRKPGEGKLGRKIKLIANCFALKAPTGYVYHYDVDIFNKGRSTAAGLDVELKYRVLNTKRNREVVNEMLRGNDFFNDAYAAYDGKKNLFCRRELDIDGLDEHFSCTVVLTEGGTADEPGPTQAYHVIVKPVRKKDTNDCTINLDTLHAVYAGILNTPPLDAIMAIETILRHGPCLRFTPVGRSFFYPPNELHPLGGGKEIWFGYHQSVVLGQWKPLVNLDVSATAFYQKGSILEYIRHILGKKDETSLHKVTSLTDAEIQTMSKKLKGMQIETTHLPTYRRKYHIVRFTREPANRLQFTLEENGVQVRKTVVQYYNEKYNLTLKYPHLPCIQARPEKKHIYLPIEICEIVQGQHYKKKLDEEDTAQMIKFTARPPHERFTKINEIRGHRADYDHDEVLQGYDMSVRNNLLSLEGRILEAPGVLYNDTDGQKKIVPFNGAWDMRGTKYFRGAEINSWVLLNFANPRFCDTSALERFAKMLCEIASGEGISINRPSSIETVDIRRKSVEVTIRNAQKKFNADLAIVVVPNASKQIYRDIKLASETILGLVTQCITDKNLARNCKPQVVSNLCQKINAKMGGVNNSLISGELPPVMRAPVMLLGADVTHASPTDDSTEGVSIAAVVASLDAHPSRYAVTVRAQKNRNEKKESIEIIVEMEEMMKELLRAFYRHTRQKRPERIIMYRDGVSEGQFEAVQNHELNCIRQACRAMQASNYEPAITYIIVQKRHHRRFMPKDSRDGVGRMKNIPPGTTVDNTVTHPLNFDFYLCSHVGIQGTSRPCHYTVIHDDNNFSADDLQKLTFYLCHTYARCTRSISCPTPVQYAHLAAYRARQHAGEQESSASSTRSTASSASFSSSALEKVKKAIKVMDGLADTMYFV